METIVRLFRVPLAIVAVVALISLWFAVWLSWGVIETMITLIALPVISIFISADSIKKTWIGSYPNFIRDFKFSQSRAEGLWWLLTEAWHNIWKWAIDPTRGM